MTPVAIIQEAQADGVMLALSPAGTIKASGKGEAVARWLAVIREHKAAILEVLRGQSLPLAVEAERVIRAWLSHIGESDPVTIAEVLNQCREDAEALAYFIGRATAELPKPAPVSKDRSRKGAS